MTTIAVSTLRNNLADAMDALSDKNYLLVARKGKIASALVDIELFEDLMALMSQDYVASIKKAREEYERGDVFSHEEVFGETK